MKTRLTFIALPLLAALPLFAASPAQTLPRAGESIEVSIVNLDVIVTDKHGQRIHGLSKNDFEVFEDGKPQPITNFAAYAPEQKSAVVDSKTTLNVPTTTPAEAPKRQRRTIAIFIERFNLPADRSRTIFDSMKKSLHDIVAPGDAVLVATWDLRTEVKLDYTDDLKKIDRTLDKIAEESSHVALDQMDNHLARLEEVRSFLQEAAEMAAGAGLGVDANSIDSALQSEATDPAMREKARMRAKAAAINSFISTMANDDGRKVMFLMTRRFSQIAGGEYFYAVSPGVPLDTYTRNEYGTFNLLEAIKATANAHNVTIYALYPLGLESTNFRSATQRYSDRNMPSTLSGAFDYQVLNNELAALDDVTKATGGTTSWGAVNIADALPRIRDDFEDYYSLAYRVNARNDNRGRIVTVKTKNPAYSVRTRKQYMEKTDDGRVRDQVIASLFRPSSAGGIDVTATLGKPQPKEKNHYVVPVSIRVPVTSLMTTQEGEKSKGAFSVYIATGRVVGETSDITKQTVPFTVDDVQKAKDGYFTYDFNLLTDFATNRLAVGVFDEVSHDSGFARVDLYEKRTD